METFGYVANRLNSFGLAYLPHIIDGTVIPTTYLRVGVARTSLRDAALTASSVTIVDIALQGAV